MSVSLKFQPMEKGKSGALELNPRALNEGMVLNDNGVLGYTTIYPKPSQLSALSRIRTRDDVLSMMSPIMDSSKGSLLKYYLYSMSE